MMEPISNKLSAAERKGEPVDMHHITQAVALKVISGAALGCVVVARSRSRAFALPPCSAATALLPRTLPPPAAHETSNIQPPLLSNQKTTDSSSTCCPRTPTPPS
jgi:hypothetical protein